MNFLYVGGMAHPNDRKGGQFLAQAFNIFIKEDDVRLVWKINTSYNPEFDSEKYLRSLIKPELQDKLTFITRFMTDEELADLYRSCDVYVCPSMGEAFMQTGLEAMACGLPMVATDWSGYLDYARPSGGFIPVKIKRRTVASYGIFDVPSGSVWVEPDVVHLSKQLRWCYENPDIIADMGKKASEYVHSCMTWLDQAKKTIEAIECPIENTKKGTD